MDECKRHERVKVMVDSSVKPVPDSSCSMLLTGKTVAALRAKLKSARQRLLAKDTARPPGSWDVVDDTFDPYAESSNISDSQLLHSHPPGTKFLDTRSRE